MASSINRGIIVTMQLVIVESPTKAKKLTQYLGSQYIVEASVGHIRDLPKSGMGVDIANNFEPTYEVSVDKKKVVSRLRELAKKATTIYLATDPDREGEAIAWHIQEILQEKKDTNKPFLRATFHEITKSAVTHAIENPSQIKQHLVDAQQARRVVDRLVGYTVSPVLWKKVRRGLSAGRVQSVALRMIVEREKEITAFIPEEYWEVDVVLSVSDSTQPSGAGIVIEGKISEQLPDGMLVARLTKLDNKTFAPKADADVEPLRAILPTAEYTVLEVEQKERKRSSLPPFTTSTLQQKASTLFGYSGKKTMSIAQQLYEEGLITYHRTDSVSLSSQSLEMARSYIQAEFGQKYLPEKPRYFAKASKNAQEAHEAIRVTDISIAPEDIMHKSARFTPSHLKVYELIWKRFLASQMENAVYSQTAATIGFTSTTEQKASGVLRSSGSILKFDGWTRLFPNQEDTILPDLQPKQSLAYTDSLLAQKFTQPPARFNDASLIKELEKRGIGRPSTYASIISVIIDRGYIERNQKRFFASPVGMTVSDFLVEHFAQIMDYEFTAQMEEDLDDVALGDKEWRAVVGAFFTPLSEKIALVTQEAQRAQIPVEKTGEPCPLCHTTDAGEIVIRTGKFGKFKSCSRYPECTFTQNIVITVPDVVCPLCKEGEITMKNTRWGKPFFGCGRYPDCNWASWKKPEQGESVTPEEWAESQAKRAERKEKWLATKAAQASKKAASATEATVKKPAKTAKKAPAKKKAATTKKTTAVKKTKTTQKVAAS